MDFYQYFSRFIQNQHIASRKARILFLSLFVVFHLRYIAEAVALKRMENFDFADGKRDKDFFCIVSESCAHSGLQGAIYHGRMKHHALQVSLTKFGKTQNSRSEEHTSEL